MIILVNTFYFTLYFKNNFANSYYIEGQFLLKFFQEN